MLPMYPGMPNSPRTLLAQAVNASQTTIEVVDGSKLPDAPNIAVIGSDENAETIKYEAKNGNTLSNVTRGFQGTARSWPAGAPIARNFTAYDYDALRQNFAAHEADNTIHVTQQEKETWNNIRADHTRGLRVEVVSSLPSNPVDGQIILLIQDDGDVKAGYYGYFDGKWL